MFTMQLKATNDPRQGSLPPGEAETPPAPRHHSRGHAKLRHRCPFGCSRSHHTHAETQHSSEAPQGTAEAHRPQSTVYAPHHHHIPYQRTPQPQQQQQAMRSGPLVSRGVGECRGSSVSKQDGTNSSLTQPVIPQDFRRQAVQYMTKRLQIDANVDVQSGKVVERRILTLEEQVYNSSSSQAEYITQLASRLATILRHIDKCRSPKAPVALQTQQEKVM